MATITNTMIEGLTNSMVQARINSIDVKPFLFGTYFPVKKVTGFSWQTLTNQVAKGHVAADLHADNGTIVRKKRPIFQSAKGDMPYIAISRELDRVQMKAYQNAADLAKTADASALVEYWGEDVDFCFNGVQSELEYIAWALLTNAGELAFTTSNNATFANEFNLDYDVDADQKVYTATDWANAASADVVGDLVTLVRTAKGKGLNPKFAFINMNELYNICSAEQIIKKCSSFAANVAGVGSTPSLEDVNKMLAREAWLNGIQLRVIDQDITREFQDGTSTTGNPFADRRLVLSETERLGSTQYDILKSDVPTILRAERAHTVVKKYGTIEPMTEVTIGEADAIPVLDTAYRNLYVKTNATSW